MTDQPPTRARRLFPNPFYVILLIASTLFTLTVLAYLVSPSWSSARADRPRPGPTEQGVLPSLALVAWLDRNGPLALSIEFGVMFVSGILAMATDRFFSGGTGTGPSRAKPHTRAKESTDGAHRHQG